MDELEKNKIKYHEARVKFNKLTDIRNKSKHNDELDKEQRQVYRSIIKPFDSNLKNACMFLGLNYRYDNPPKNYIDFTRSKIIFS